MLTNVFWGGAVVSIVVASWFFYRFVAPKGWRQWTRAGIVQAFVIAFYAEMVWFSRYALPVGSHLRTRHPWELLGRESLDLPARQPTINNIIPKKEIA